MDPLPPRRKAAGFCSPPRAKKVTTDIMPGSAPPASSGRRQVYATDAASTPMETPGEVRRQLNWGASTPGATRHVEPPPPSAVDDSSVKVVVRLRPLSQREVQEGADVAVRVLEGRAIAVANQAARFHFDYVAGPSETQEDIFAAVGRPMVANCLAGVNSSIFAYGQTGSGKTYTMLGATPGTTAGTTAGSTPGPPQREHCGLTLRVFEDLFTRICQEEEQQQSTHVNYTCKCSFLEIYNEQITDLLNPSQRSLQIREDVKRGVHVEGLSEVAVASAADVSLLIVRGSANRRVAATGMNAESSRSHSVLTCCVTSHFKVEGRSATRYARLNLVDLAGSERQKHTGAQGERLKEAASINKSLSQLGNVIKILGEAAAATAAATAGAGAAGAATPGRHIPYRDSRLTFLLQDSLGGNAKTVIICAVSPSSTCVGETLSTLGFAQRARAVQNRAVVNQELSNDVRELRQQIRVLKAELVRVKTQPSPFGQMPTTPYTPGEDSTATATLAALSPLSQQPPFPSPDPEGSNLSQLKTDTPLVGKAGVGAGRGGRSSEAYPDEDRNDDEDDDAFDDMAGYTEMKPPPPPRQLAEARSQGQGQIRRGDGRDGEEEEQGDENLEQVERQQARQLSGKGSDSNVATGGGGRTGQPLKGAPEILSRRGGSTGGPGGPVGGGDSESSAGLRRHLAIDVGRADTSWPSQPDGTATAGGTEDASSSPSVAIGERLQRGIRVLESPRRVSLGPPNLPHPPLARRLSGASSALSPLCPNALLSGARGRFNSPDAATAGGGSGGAGKERGGMPGAKAAANGSETRGASWGGGQPPLPLPRTLSASAGSGRFDSQKENMLPAMMLPGGGGPLLMATPPPGPGGASPIIGQVYYDRQVQEDMRSKNAASAHMAPPAELPQQAVPTTCQVPAPEDNRPQTTTPATSEGQKTDVAGKAGQLLAAALRREQAAEAAARKMRAEIDQLHRLVAQYREEREGFATLQEIRDEKIQRLESLAGGAIAADTFLGQEWSSMLFERKLLQQRVEAHPEVTRVRLENERLQNELRQLSSFHQAGEREALLEEVGSLRDQVLAYLDASSANSPAGPTSYMAMTPGMHVHALLATPRGAGTPARRRSFATPEQLLLRRSADIMRRSIDRTVAAAAGAVAGAGGGGNASADVVTQQLVAPPLARKSSEKLKLGHDAGEREQEGLTAGVAATGGRPAGGVRTPQPLTPLTVDRGPPGSLLLSAVLEEGGGALPPSDPTPLPGGTTPTAAAANKRNGTSVPTTPAPWGWEEREWEEREAEWLEREAEWVAIVEEQRDRVVELQRQVAREQREALAERRCAAESKAAVHAALEGHARLLDQYSELQERHISLLAKHRKISDSIKEASGLAAQRGLSANEKKLIKGHLAELAALRVEREKEVRERDLHAKCLLEEMDDLRCQVADTEEAVRAAEELLERLRQAECAVASAQGAAAEAEQKANKLTVQLEVMKRRQRQTMCPMCVMADNVKFIFPEDALVDLLPSPGSAAALTPRQLPGSRGGQLAQAVRRSARLARSREQSLGGQATLHAAKATGGGTACARAQAHASQHERRGGQAGGEPGQGEARPGGRQGRGKEEEEEVASGVLRGSVEIDSAVGETRSKPRSKPKSQRGGGAPNRSAKRATPVKSSGGERPSLGTGGSNGTTMMPTASPPPTSHGGSGSWADAASVDSQSPYAANDLRGSFERRLVGAEQLPSLTKAMQFAQGQGQGQGGQRRGSGAEGFGLGGGDEMYQQRLEDLCSDTWEANIDRWHRTQRASAEKTGGWE